MSRGARRVTLQILFGQLLTQPYDRSHELPPAGTSLEGLLVGDLSTDWTGQFGGRTIRLEPDSVGHA